jgi:hypothetical protein
MSETGQYPARTTFRLYLKAALPASVEAVVESPPIQPAIGASATIR